jgi:hypothetical protein
MLRKLTAIAAGVSAGLIVLSAFAQTPPKKKAAPKKHKHPTTAPARPAASAPPAADPDLYTPPPEPAPAPAPSAAPASEPAPPSAPATNDSSAPATEAPAAKDTEPAQALRPLSVALLGGWGSNPAAGIGFGLRAGYTLPLHVYVGGTFIYHLGESENGATAGFLYPGGEVGYELKLGPLFVRPYVGLGLLVLREAAPTAVPPESLTRMYFGVWPGLTAAYAITPNFFIGADARYLLSGYSFFGIFGTVGARF